MYILHSASLLISRTYHMLYPVSVDRHQKPEKKHIEREKEDE